MTTGTLTNTDSYSQAPNVPQGPKRNRNHARTTGVATSTNRSFTGNSAHDSQPHTNIRPHPSMYAGHPRQQWTEQQEQSPESIGNFSRNQPPTNQGYDPGNGPLTPSSSAATEQAPPTAFYQDTAMGTAGNPSIRQPQGSNGPAVNSRPSGQLRPSPRFDLQALQEELARKVSVLPPASQIPRDKPGSFPDARTSFQKLGYDIQTLNETRGPNGASALKRSNESFKAVLSDLRQRSAKLKESVGSLQEYQRHLESVNEEMTAEKIGAEAQARYWRELYRSATDKARSEQPSRLSDVLDGSEVWKRTAEAEDTVDDDASEASGDTDNTSQSSGE